MGEAAALQKLSFTNIKTLDLLNGAPVFIQLENARASLVNFVASIQQALALLTQL
jgi:hypothetical protein